MAKVANNPKRKILVLHGDRQTGELLVSRMAPLKRKLLKVRTYSDRQNIQIDDSNCQIGFIAPDGPFPWKYDPTLHRESKTLSQAQHEENDLMRTWWNRNGNDYDGLNDSFELLLRTWNENKDLEGILGFSRGARLAHLVAVLHQLSNGRLFHGLQYIIMASGYGDVPLPTNFPPRDGICGHACAYDNDDAPIPIPTITIPSMHIMGKKDRLISMEQSRVLSSQYRDPVVHEHDGGHHVPMRAADTRAILTFIDSVTSSNNAHDNDTGGHKFHTKSQSKLQSAKERKISSAQSLPQTIQPDEEHALAQIEECTSISIIFSDEFHLLSPINGTTTDEYGEEQSNYIHPISYIIQLKPSTDQLQDDPDAAQLWPKKDIALKVTYPHNYPDVMPIFELHHELNLLEFKLRQSKALLDGVNKVAMTEIGMPCVMSCVYRAREFFEEGGLESSLLSHPSQLNDGANDANHGVTHGTDGDDENDDRPHPFSDVLKSSSSERIQACIDEGLQIAYSILRHKTVKKDGSDALENSESRAGMSVGSGGKGGSWKYTIGLVGKPSAGKSTFFNSATGFARQKGGDEVDDEGVAIGGADMAPHPFTTIDPNVGYCLVPAPAGSCPEDDIDTNGKIGTGLSDEFVGCTHGRDSRGRRLIPVMLKDVAGLVPGAYKGRGRGNKFLDDLTDADVLIHVLDSSGTADTEGNTVVVNSDADSTDAGSNPLNDLGWIFNELIQWVRGNIGLKWDVVRRKGRTKLAGMLTGYKQNQAFVWDVLLTLENHMYTSEGRDHALDHLDTWDEGDLYRLVATFLGVRFPVALAMNKHDIPSSKKFCKDILQALPIHGAHVGTPLSAHQEMNFVRQQIYSVLAPDHKTNKSDKMEVSTPPNGVWDCLQSAIKLRKPVLVFPVVDMENFQPLPGMTNLAISHASLPNAGMVTCLLAAGGASPTLWSETDANYSSKSCKTQILRDVLIMKPGSTIEDAFSTLKGIGALEGEFVRAEAVDTVRGKPKLVKKDEALGRHNRILKIMTTKRREWQNNF